MSAIVDEAVFAALLGRNRAIPVVTFRNPADAVPVGRALLAGGVGTIEVTLRTPVGLDCIERLVGECPDLVVGAGTVLRPEQAEAARRAGARYLVSPGHTAVLKSCAKTVGVPWMLGATSLSEVMGLREDGFLFQKFFPAEAVGGVATLKAIGSVLPDVTFCPTGGITAERASDYLALSNVAAVGGSWFVPAATIDLQSITAVARATATRLNP